MLRLKGLVHKYGANVDTDVIIPARYLNVSDAEELASHCMEDLDPDFVRKVRPGDIIVAETNFGCGSSREQAVSCLKGHELTIVAKGFARIFLQNGINLGLRVAVVPELEAATGDDVEIGSGRVSNRTTGRSFAITPLPSARQAIVEAGGLIAYTRQRLEQGQP